VNLKDTVKFSIKYSFYPIAFFSRIFYPEQLLDLKILRTNELCAKDTAGGNQVKNSGPENQALISPQGVEFTLKR
jgi:hypothetical protein